MASDVNIVTLAQRIAQEHLKNIEYCAVYEDEEVQDEGLTDEEMIQVHNLIVRYTNAVVEP